MRHMDIHSSRSIVMTNIYIRRVVPWTHKDTASTIIRQTTQIFLVTVDIIIISFRMYIVIILKVKVWIELEMKQLFLLLFMAVSVMDMQSSDLHHWRPRAPSYTVAIGVPYQPSFGNLCPACGLIVSIYKHGID